MRRPAPRYGGGPAGKPRKTFEGTPEYVAPELLQAYDAAPARNAAADPMRAAATFASDVYSLAVLANEVASGKAPYEGAERPDAQLQTVIETTYTTPALCRAVVAGRRPDLAQFLAAQLAAAAFPQLVERAWAADAAARPTARSFAESLVDLGEADYGDCLGEEIHFLKGAFEPTWRRKHLDVLFLVPERLGHELPPPPPPPLPELSAAQIARLDALGRARSGGPRRRGHGVELAPGPRESMEDAAAAAEWGTSACYVVADGHGGAEAAERVVDLLPRLIGAELLAGGADDDAVRAALQRAFLRGDEACRPAKGGACVVVALVLGDDLFVASAGDCRAILDRDGDETWTWSRGCVASPDAAQGPFAGGVVALSRDHRPSDAAETARVKATGGRIFTLPGESEPRVAARSGKGGLRVTRALGHGCSYYRGVIPDPDVVGPVRLSGRDATLTLVTDGVSDRLSDDAVAQILRDTCPEPHLGPKALLVAALDAGADDNVCALVVYLNRHP